MMVSLLTVFCGGAMGSLARFGIGSWMGRRDRDRFPIAILAINILGSFLLGLLSGYLVEIARLPISLDVPVLILAGVGFLGAFTTFSTFSMEALQLWLNKEWFYFTLYITLTLLSTIGFLAIGYGIILFAV